MSIQISARGGGGNKTERKPAWEYSLYVHADTEHCCNQTCNHAQIITPQLTVS